jgi:hypothetical protein
VRMRVMIFVLPCALPAHGVRHDIVLPGDAQ